MNSTEEKIIGYVEGTIGWIVFNNPAKRNAVSLDMWRALPTVIARLEADPGIRVIVLRGAGDQAFVAGADISKFEDERKSPETRKRYEEVEDEALGRLENTSFPTIAMIHGFCMGGGVAIALACDLRYAADDALFAIPAARLGIAYPSPILKKLIEIAGVAVAGELLFTARRFSAVEAEKRGLVNDVLPKSELEASVRATAASISENAPLTIRAAKQTMKELAKGAAADLTLCDRLIAECFDSADYVEGYRAFLEKRKPLFRGR